MAEGASSKERGEITFLFTTSHMASRPPPKPWEAASDPDAALTQSTRSPGPPRLPPRTTTPVHDPYASAFGPSSYGGGYGGGYGGMYGGGYSRFGGASRYGGGMYGGGEQGGFGVAAEVCADRMMSLDVCECLFQAEEHT